jgi:DNA excision repair protein ERCC-3
MPGTGALIVQSNTAILLDAHHPDFEAARDAILPFANLEKSPEHIHTWSLTPLSLWNAAQAGLDARAVISALAAHSRYQLPPSVERNVESIMARFGRVSLRPSLRGPGFLFLEAADKRARTEIASNRRAMKYLEADEEGGLAGFVLSLADRGTVKLELMRAGWPCLDLAPLAEGEPLEIRLRDVDSRGMPFSPRPYQADAARAFCGDLGPGTGFGTVVLPCGAGKTIVGMAVMERLCTNTLILTANSQAVRQWRDELRDKTHLDPSLVGEYTGDRKEVRPVTVATYQILVWRPDKEGDYPHFSLFRSRAWGLIIYDEVHLLPAPIFRITAELQAVRRLGLTATLVREDGREEDVFALVGPKRYDVPWKELESAGWIASAYCREVRVPMDEGREMAYAAAETRAKARLAGENPFKLAVAAQLAAHHAGEGILVIGEYIAQLEEAARILGAPLITGKTPGAERLELYQRFREGELRLLVVSRVANFAIDLPDASVAIQLSGSFGSRQEEAQRLGRILRPKHRNSYFYAIVSEGTVDETYSANRQKFLVEQGYRYAIERRDPRLDLPSPQGAFPEADQRA